VPKGFHKALFGSQNESLQGNLPFAGHQIIMAVLFLQSKYQKKIWGKADKVNLHEGWSTTSITAGPRDNAELWMATVHVEFSRPQTSLLLSPWRK